MTNEGVREVTDDLYAEMDSLTAMWQQIEDKLHGPEVEVPGQNLSLSRTASGKVRLCWNKTPLAECSVEVKITAAEQLPDFDKALLKVRRDQLRRAQTMVQRLQGYLSSSKVGGNT